MKAVRALGVALVGLALLAGAAPGTAAGPVYKHYVACRDMPPNATPKQKLALLSKAKPKHNCTKTSKKGAFFSSLKADVTYKVCVRFPVGKPQCATPRPATKGTLYVNGITSNIPGVHRVTWFVNGNRVGAFNFRVKP